VARVTTIARGGVAIVFHVGPSEASHALKAAGFTETTCKLELTKVKEKTDGVD
jgi:hypothetical protein